MEKVKKVLCSNLFLSVLIMAAVTFVYLIFTGFNIFYTVTDDTFSLLFNRGNDKDEFLNVLLNYFLIFVLVKLQSVFTHINFFVVSQLLLVSASFILINYILIKKFGKKFGCIIAVVADLLYVSAGVIVFQWTHTTAICCTAGYLCLYAAFFIEKKRSNKIIQGIAAVALVFLGSLYRFKSFEIVTLIFCVLGFCLLVIDVWKSKSFGQSFKKSFCDGVKKYYKALLSLILIVLLAFACNICSEQIKLSSDEYVSYKEFNSARASAADYNIAGYQGNEEFYNSVGVYSQNDLACLKSWLMDYGLYNTETLRKISDYSSQPEFGLRFSVGGLFDKVTGKLLGIFGSAYIAVLIAAAAFGILVLLLLYKFRNKRACKYIMIAGITLLWLVFFYVFRFTEASVLCIPIAVLSVVTALLCNRYQYFLTGVFSICTVALYVYMYLSRINFRSAFTVLLPCFIYMLISFDKPMLRKQVAALKGKHKSAVVLAIVMLLTLSSVFAEGLVWRFMIKQRSAPVDQSRVLDYLNENKDITYVYDSALKYYLTYNYYEPLKSSYCPDNALNMSTADRSYYNQGKESHNFGSLFEDMIDNKSAAYIFANDEEAPEMLETFYNEHYAEDGERIRLVKLDEVSDCSVYSVVAEAE